MFVRHNGVEFSIAHLAPMDLECPCAEFERPLVVRVTFSGHCYTESFDPDRHSRDDIVYRDGVRPRAFSHERYGLSLGLPDLIARLPDVRVHQTSQRRNYVYAAPMVDGGRAYLVFFTLHRAARDGIDLRLFVESAYLSELSATVRRRPHAIRFKVLATKVFTNQPVRFAAR